MYEAEDVAPDAVNVAAPVFELLAEIAWLEAKVPSAWTEFVSAVTDDSKSPNCVFLFSAVVSWFSSRWSGMSQFPLHGSRCFGNRSHRCWCL